MLLLILLSMCGCWLRFNRIPYDALVVEADKLAFEPGESQRGDRYSVAASVSMNVFVEDNPKNARKLADLCGIVFLMEHPYNEAAVSGADGDEMPANVVLVSSWAETMTHLHR